MRLRAWGRSKKGAGCPWGTCPRALFPVRVSAFVFYQEVVCDAN